MKRLSNCMRWATLIASGGLVLQATGCNTSQFLQVLQTIFLGFSATASYMIIKNIN